jgi:hypothetical protein
MDTNKHEWELKGRKGEKVTAGGGFGFRVRRLRNADCGMLIAEA